MSPAPQLALKRYAVIMAGGTGTRFWPLSRQRMPKQLLRLSGRRSMLQATAARLAPLVGWPQILVVTNAAQAAEVRRQLPRLSRRQVIVEPLGRSTLPCAVLAAQRIGAAEEDALMILAPADHSIPDAAAFRRTAKLACTIAQRDDALVTIGITPRQAETGYGYIELGKRLDDAASWVKCFHEKPNRAAAERYVRSGRFLWNAGVFVWRKNVFMAATHRLQPRLVASLATVRSSAQLRRAYESITAVAIDTGLMEPQSRLRSGAGRVAVVPAQFEWSDLGSWAALPDVWSTDAHGTTAVGRVIEVEARRSIVFSPNRLVALVGVDNLIVVDSGDAILVCARDRAQDVRRVTEALAARKWSAYL